MSKLITNQKSGMITDNQKEFLVYISIPEYLNTEQYHIKRQGSLPFPVKVFASPNPPHQNYSFTGSGY